MKKLIVIFSSLVMTLLMVSCNNLAGDKQEPAVDSKSQFTVSIVPKKESSRLISPVDRHWIDVFTREDWNDGGHLEPYGDEGGTIFVPQECVDGFDEQIFELFRMEEPGIYKDIDIDYDFNKVTREAEIRTKLIDGFYKFRVNLYYLPVCMDDLNGVLVQDVDNKLDLCGEVEFEVNGPDVHHLTVEIGPKKLGTGHAGPFTVEFVNLDDFIDDFTGGKNVTARLVSRDNPENVYLCDEKEVLDDEPPTMKFEITDSIPSGFYDLELGLVDGNSFIKLVDIDEDLVEIIDEKPTSSDSIQALDPMNHREYTNADAPNSEKLNKILDHLKDIPGGRNSTFSLADAPYIDMTKFASHKNYSFEISNGLKFNVVNGRVCYTEGPFNFHFVSDAKIEKIVGDISEEYNEIWLFNNATVTINSAGFDFEEPVSFELNVVNNDLEQNFEEYYTSGKDVAVVEGDDEEKVQFYFDEDDYKLVKTCETTEEGNIYHYRVLKADDFVEGDFNVGTAVPEFKLEGTVSGGEIESPIVFESGEYIEFGDVLFTLNPVCLDGLAEFAPGTQFTYTINGTVVPETDMNESKTGISMALARTFVPLNYSGSNLIQCTATSGDYSKSKTFYLKFSVKIDTPVMLWNAAENEFIENSNSITGLVGMQAFSLEELENNIKIDSDSTKPMLNAQVKNFCFDTVNGDLLIIESADGLCYFVRCDPNDLSAGPKERYLIEGLASNYTISSMTWFNDKLYFVNKDFSNALYSYVPSSVEGMVMESYDGINAITTDREYLYISTKEYDSETGYIVYIKKLDSSLNLISSSEVLTSENCGSYELMPIGGNFSFVINDMIVQNGNIYALVHESFGYSCSRGVLIKLSDKGTGYEIDSSFVKGWYDLEVGVTQNNPLFSTKTNVFYGPRKFIAIKPDVLVIADEGAYHDGSSTKKNSNRVMIYDLNGELKNVYNVDVTLGGAVGAKSGYGSYYEYY